MEIKEYFVCPSLVHFSCSFISECRLFIRETEEDREEPTTDDHKKAMAPKKTKNQKKREKKQKKKDLEKAKDQDEQ